MIKRLIAVSHALLLSPLDLANLYYETRLAELKFHGGSAEKIIKIRPTVAEQSVKKHFPIENAIP